MPEMEFEDRTVTTVLKKPPVSRLQLLQARFQRKLLLEKEEKMMRMYDHQQPEFGSRSRPEGGGGGGGGAVRQFFAQRRTQNVPVDPLSSSNGIISLQQSGGFQTGTFSRSNGRNSNNNHNKNGSPVGWDKSYPLSPLDRDSSSSSSGYDSFNSTSSTAAAAAASSPYKNNGNNNVNNRNRNVRRGPAPAVAPVAAQAPVPSRRNLVPPVAAARRAPSLDRRPARNGYAGGGAGAGNSYGGGIKRSTSQVLVNNGRAFDEDEGFVPFSRIRNNQQIKLDVPKAYPTARKAYPSNQAAPVNGTYKLPPRGRDPSEDGDDSNPRGRRLIVPDIGYVAPSTRTKAAPPAPVKKASPPRGPVGRTADPNLVSCHLCGRSFAPDRIEKHETICEKSNAKKRKVFDPTKMRIKGTDLEEFYRQSGKAGNNGRNKGAAGAAAPEPKKSDWRQKRNNFIETLRQAKVVQRHMAAGGRASDLPPPPPMDTSDYVQCPHCNRKFSEGAAERHIPKCKNIKSNKNGDIRR